MHISLPASSDIFLTGGKTHSSKVRLAQWLIGNIQRYETFIDIGAHIGFFSLLARYFSGNKIAVQSFEPSRAAFALLSQNTKAHKAIAVHQAAVGSENGEAVFHEFGHSYAEFSSLVLDNYDKNLRQTLEKEKTDYTVPVQTLDAITSALFSGKMLLKIDTEGNEMAVLQGADALLKRTGCDFVIEFLDNGNDTYRQAEALLRANDFRGFLITEDGNLQEHDNILLEMKKQQADSENVVFSKEKMA